MSELGKKLIEAGQPWLRTYDAHEKLDMTKPHNGGLYNAQRVYYGNGRYFYTCIFRNHPVFKTTKGYTSNVVKEVGDEIETLNSRYTILSRLPQTERMLVEEYKEETLYERIPGDRDSRSLRLSTPTDF